MTTYNDQLISASINLAFREHLTTKFNIASADDSTVALQQIKTWITRITEKKRLFSNAENKLEDTLISMIKATPRLSHIDPKIIKNKFYVLPQYLCELEYLATRFPNEFYIKQHGLNTLSDHVRYFKVKYLKQLLSQYSENWDVEKLTQIIDAIINNNESNNKIFHKPTMNRVTFSTILNQLFVDNGKLIHFLYTAINTENNSIKTSAQLHFIAQMYTAQKSHTEILQKMSEIGSAEDIMWLLCNDYNLYDNREVRARLGQLILFLSKQGVKPENCIRNNISAANLLLSIDSKKYSDDYKIEHKNVVYNAIERLTRSKYRYKNLTPIIEGAKDTLIAMIGFIAWIPTLITFAAFGISATVGFPLSFVAFLLPIMFRKGIFNFVFTIHEILFEPKPALNRAKTISVDDKETFQNFFKPSRQVSLLSTALAPVAKSLRILSNIFNYTTEYKKHEILQPIDGVKHIIMGALQIVSALGFIGSIIVDPKNGWKLAGANILNGLLKIVVQGPTEILSAPFALLIKWPLRLCAGIFVSRESRLIDKAKQFSKTIETQRQNLDVQKETQSPDLIRHSLFNGAAKLHTDMKDLKQIKYSHTTPSRKEEKVAWGKIKSAFHSTLNKKQTPVTEDEFQLFHNYSNSCKF